MAIDPNHLFIDSRLTGFCIFCGGLPNTRDHCPSKVFLDEPYPSDLPVVQACKDCNSLFSKDEQYLACLVECVIHGSTNPQDLSREKIQRILSENPPLANRILAARKTHADGSLIWGVEDNRVKAVILKLARGHMHYELGLPHSEEPDHFAIYPTALLTVDELTKFENPECFSPRLFPELGSRAFLRVIKEQVYNRWIVVQPGRYRYLVGQMRGDFVQMVISEYLACEIIWE